MERAGRITILRPGIFVEGQEVNQGYAEEFSDEQILGIADNQISLSLDKITGNNLYLVLLAPPHYRAHPIGHQVEMSAFLKFGEEPGSATVKLGQPSNETAIIEFLGHPDRDILQPIIQNQGNHYDPNVTATFPTPSFETSRWGQEQLIMASPTIQTFYKTNQAEYPSRVMFSLIKHQFKPYDIPHVSLVTNWQADLDELVRVSRLDDSFNFSGDDPDCFNRAAEMIVFLRNYATKFNEIGIDFVSNSFSRRLAEYIDNKYDNLRFPYDDAKKPAFFKDFFGFDWIAIKSGLRVDEVKEEAERLQLAATAPI